jgi:hypothetical protein
MIFPVDGKYPQGVGFLVLKFLLYLTTITIFPRDAIARKQENKHTHARATIFVHLLKDISEKT